MHFAAFGKLMPYPIPKTLLRMKLTAIFIFLFALQSMAESFAQVTLKEKNATLEKVLQTIKKQSGYDLVYQKEMVRSKGKPVAVNLSNVTLSTALELIFKDQDLDYELVGKIITVRERLTIIKTPSQNLPVIISPIQNELIDIRGLIKDEIGKPVIGASVLVKGIKKGALTNENGEFRLLNVDSKSSLIISALNIETIEININGRTDLGIITAKMKVDELDKVIIRAYGTTTKRMNTGSIVKVSSEEISKQPISNPIAALSGRVSGVQVTQFSGIPGSYSTVQIRGRNSIANGNDPLFIIDGVPFASRPLNSSFFGGGVISSPLSNLDPSIIESIEVLKDADATAIYGSRGANGVILITTKNGYSSRVKTNINIYSGLGKVTRTMELLNTKDYLAMRREAFANDLSTPTTANSPDLLLWDSTRYTDWQKVLIGETMHITNANISISGGSQQTQFSLGGTYFKETTTIPGKFGMEKFSANITLGHRTINEKFAFQFSANYLRNSNTLPGGDADITRQITLAPNAPKLFDSFGNLNWENSTWQNPLQNILKVFNSNAENFIANLTLNYNLTNSIKFKLTGGYNKLTSIDHASSPSYSLNPVLGLSPSAKFGRKSIETLITEPQIVYESKSSLGNIQITAGASLQSTKEYGLVQLATGYSSDDLLNSIRAAASVNTAVESDINYRYIGFFGRFNYDFKRKYLLSITMRRDGSSRYGENNRFANFGSVGVGWILSNEVFLKKQSLISFAKIKGSAGTTGNDQIGDYKYLDLYNPGTYPYLGVTTFSPVQLQNSNYSWEQVKKFELGVDLGFFNNRLMISANYYHNITTNQLVSYPLPAITGFSGVLRNIPTTIRNNGLELEMNSILVKKKKWDWSISANITFPKNKLLAYEGIENSTYANRYVVGQSLFIVKKLEHLGVDPITGNHSFTDFDKDGRITAPNDYQSIIFTGQQYFGGIQNTINYGKFGFSFLIQFAKELNGENYLNFFSRPGLVLNQPTIVLNRWRQPGDLSSVQRYAISNSISNTAFSNYRQSTAAYSNASFIRLRNVYVTYNLLTDKLRKKSITDFKLFIQCHNILTITKFYGLDPESKSALPPIKMITGGIQLTF